MLSEHRRQHVEDRLAAGSAWSESGGLVFVTQWGEPLYPDTVTALMSKLIGEYNKLLSAPAKPLPHARLHDLRHLHPTTLLLAGVPVHVVAARLGQADPAVTLRVYSHVLGEQAPAVGDIFAHAVRLQLAIPLASHNGRSVDSAFTLLKIVRRSHLVVTCGDGGGVGVWSRVKRAAATPLCTGWVRLAPGRAAGVCFECGRAEGFEAGE